MALLDVPPVPRAEGSGEMEMTECEQVIAELLYLKHDCLEGSATDQTLDKAIAMLKVQKPRVLNVGDFYGEEFGYLEYMPDRPGFSNFDPAAVLIGDIDEKNVTVIFRSASVVKLPLEKMYKNWRIWSEYPTHELLRTVKWDGTNA